MDAPAASLPRHADRAAHRGRAHRRRRPLPRRRSHRAAAGARRFRHTAHRRSLDRGHRRRPRPSGRDRRGAARADHDAAVGGHVRRHRAGHAADRSTDPATPLDLDAGLEVDPDAAARRRRLVRADAARRSTCWPSQPSRRGAVRCDALARALRPRPLDGRGQLRRIAGRRQPRRCRTSTSGRGLLDAARSGTRTFGASTWRASTVSDVADAIGVLRRRSRTRRGRPARDLTRPRQRRDSARTTSTMMRMRTTVPTPMYMRPALPRRPVG